MSDYRVKVSVRNANILRAIEKDGCKSVLQFCKKWGIEGYYTDINALICFRKLPVTQPYGPHDSHGGRLTTAAQTLTECLGCLPEDLWNDEQLWLWLPKNASAIDVRQDEMERMVDAMDAKKAIAAIKGVGGMTKRELHALERRTADDEPTLEEVGRETGVTRERVRKLEASGLRKMRARAIKAGVTGD